MQFNHQRGHFVSSGDSQLYIEQIGKPNGPILILLHGGFGTIADFNGISPFLSQHFHLIAIDSRGHGRSTLGNQQLSYPLLADDLQCVIDCLQLDEFNLLGFSSGGCTAYRYAIRQDRRLAKLVTIGANWALTENDDQWIIYQAMSAEKWQQQFPQSVEDYLALNPQPDWPRFAQSVLALWRNTDNDNLPFEQISRIDNPTLVIRGDQDQLCPLASIVQQQALMKNMHFCNLPFADHVAFADQPELFNTSIKLFFNLA